MTSNKKLVYDSINGYWYDPENRYNTDPVFKEFCNNYDNAFNKFLKDEINRYYYLLKHFP